MAGLLPRIDWDRRLDRRLRFRQAVEAVLRPGTTVLVTPDSLRAGSTGQSVTVVEG
jgi:hypothetical protein